jgi:hypothetical protein
MDEKQNQFLGMHLCFLSLSLISQKEFLLPKKKLDMFLNSPYSQLADYIL